MPIVTTPSELSIHLINSLGGPPLPTGCPAPVLRVVLENQAAALAGISATRVAGSLIAKRQG